MRKIEKKIPGRDSHFLYDMFKIAFQGELFESFHSYATVLKKLKKNKKKL